jgi:tRNA wybutosine-synthesizing protein 1
VRHVALSLTGEPISYPRINEMIDKFHDQDISTFLVTNATFPDQIRDLHPVTQLYISVDAPTKELLYEVDKPLFEDFWERLQASLNYMAEKTFRTCIRLTLIKGINMFMPEKYAELIMKGDPDFIEVKSYMWVGASTQRLVRDNMPLHEETVAFTKELITFLPEYDIVSEHISSRVVMLAKKKFKKDGVWHTWIDFPKFHQLFRAGKEIVTEQFLKKTPTTGLSGKGTLTHKKPKDQDKVFIDLIDEVEIAIDEKTPELNFWDETLSDAPDDC